MTSHIPGRSARRLGLARFLSGSRRRLTRLLTLPVTMILVAGALLAGVPPTPAGGIVRQPHRVRKPASGHAAVHLGRRLQRLIHPGLRGSLQRQCRRVDQFQDPNRSQQLLDRHLPDGLLRWRRRTSHQEHPGDRPEPAGLQHQHRYRPGRLRQLERVSNLERSGDDLERELAPPDPSDQLSPPSPGSAPP